MPSPLQILYNLFHVRLGVPRCVASHRIASHRRASHQRGLVGQEVAGPVFDLNDSLAAVQERGDSAFDPTGRTRKQ